MKQTVWINGKPAPHILVNVLLPTILFAMAIGGMIGVFYFADFSGPYIKFGGYGKLCLLLMGGSAITFKYIYYRLCAQDTQRNNLC